MRRIRARWFSLLGLALTLGCDSGNSGDSSGDSTESFVECMSMPEDSTSATCDTTSSTGDTNSTTEDTSGTSTEETTDTSSNPNQCIDYPAHMCSAPLDCELVSCAVPWFSDEGCVKAGCKNDSDCVNGEVCFRASDFKGCSPSEVMCFDSADGSCECWVTDDCQGAWCIPKEEVPKVICDAYPAHTCSEAITCSGANCGAGKPFSTEGCLRSTCESDKDCGEKERCYRAEDFGGCESSNITCEDGEDGSCECGQTEDCGGAYCIPEDEFPAQQCEGYPAHSCSATVDCTSQPCGDLDPFTNKGCLRTSCTSDEDCASGQSCFKAEDWGECASSTIFCEEDESTLQCNCGSTDDCGGAYCVDTQAVPSICEQHTSADACIANNNPDSLYACAWLDVVQVDIKSKSCEATVPSGRCIAMHNVGDGCSENPSCGEYPRSYVQPESEWILRNTADCGMEPLGWEQCIPGSSEPACQCACPE